MKIYLIFSQSGSVVSKILKHVTKAQYNHVSISLDLELNEMYSFGRLHPYNPFFAGLVKEHPNVGTYKRFKNVDAKIIGIDIDENNYLIIKNILHKMYSNKEIYKYNLLGLVYSSRGIVYAKENHYYCSEFVREVLDKGNAIDISKFKGIIKPIDFLNIENYEEIYVGDLNNYEYMFEKIEENINEKTLMY